ncbi:MAG: hypothetical protein EPN93_09320 [Spirochaetes bacterium]|nr:MAG: hypothetical protein EPN93_09320 [Spirochaetota bacterium]
MKRILAMIVACAFVFAAAGCSKDKAKEKVARAGVVNFVVGDAFLIMDGKESKAKVEDAIKEGMKIKTTGDNSSIEIYFGENAIKVTGNTIVEVKSLSTYVATNNEETSLYVEKGEMFSKISSKLAKGDVYEVKSPTTTAGVRGTEFLLTEDDAKGNIAVVDGAVEVKNNSKPGDKAVVVNQDEEVDVVKGKDMVKKQLSDDKKRRLKILADIREMKKEIWEKMRQQREEIKKAVEDQRKANKEMLDKQKSEDKARVADQKETDKKNIGDIKDKSKEEADKATGDAKAKMEESKGGDTKAGADAAKSMMDAMKPKIEKKLGNQ